MDAFRFEQPATVEAACSILAGANGRGKVLAGGTDLLVQLKTGALQHDAVVIDVKTIPEMSRIADEASGFRIGAAVPAAALVEHRGLTEAWPGVVEAVGLIGSTQIQGRATVGGNLCNASPAADTVPALIAAGATCRVASPSGAREVAVGEIVTGPGATSLARGELVVELLLPNPRRRSADAYLRMIPRSEMDIAIVAAGVWLALDDDGRCSAARVALGAVAPTALEVPAAAEALVGSALDDAALQRLREAASAACHPIDDRRGTVAYRTRVAGVLAARAACIAQKRAAARG